MADRTLTVFRHAKSDWPDGVPDAERPLSERGIRDAPAAGRWLAEHVRPELVLVSPATRAWTTWELAALEVPAPPRVRAEDRLYDASAGDLLAVVQNLDDSVHDVLLVAHNPGLSMLAGTLTGNRLELKTCGVVVTSWAGTWADAGPGVARVVASAKPRG